MKRLHRYAVKNRDMFDYNRTETIAVWAFSAEDAVFQERGVFAPGQVSSVRVERVEPWIKSKHGDWPWATVEEEDVS